MVCFGKTIKPLQVITRSSEIKNAGSFGPIEIQSGITSAGVGSNLEDL